jgi:amino acid transporter
VSEEEDRRERVNRELMELLNELRVALPGVQVLFAFLLTVPFQSNFQRITDFQRNVYYATLLLSALSVVLLVSPAAQHRLLFRKQDKEPMLFRFNKYAIAGQLCLGAALTGALLLVTSYLFGTPRSIITTAITVVVILGFWVVFPLLRREYPLREKPEPPRQG